MNVDLSTINPLGLMAIFIFCSAFIFALSIFLKSKPKIKGSKGSIEIGDELKKDNLVKVEITPHKTGGDIMRQLIMARNEVEGMTGDLLETVLAGGNFTDTDKTIADLRCKLFGANLLYGISRCYTINHIGKTVEELEAYANRTAREFSYLLDIFPEQYGLETKLGKDWLQKKLFLIFKDGKGL